MTHIVIIGAGISGLTVAYRLQQAAPDTRVTLLEAGECVGGTAQTVHRQGFHIDEGPNGFLTNVPETWDLAADLGLEMCAAADSAKKRWLYGRRGLIAAPASPLAFLASPLLPWSAKLRVAWEPFARRAQQDDETVYAFAERRLGRAFAEEVIRPMVVGITAGDARFISLKALFPRMWKLENSYGGLVRAWLQRTIERRLGKNTEPERIPGGPDGPGGRLTTCATGGIGDLCVALAAAIGEGLHLNRRVTRLAFDPQQARPWTVTCAQAVYAADQVVLAIPAYAAAPLLEPLLPHAARMAAAIPYAGVRVIALAYPRSAIAPRHRGFGFLVHPETQAAILGCLWTSDFFPHQAPPDQALFRVLLGGTIDPHLVTADDTEALLTARGALARIMGLHVPATLVHQRVWPRGIPQYVPGHLAKVAALRQALQQSPGLHLCGNAYDGIGINDCVRGATQVAQRVQAAARGAAGHRQEKV